MTNQTETVPNGGMMGCSTENLNAYADGELADADAEAIREHTVRCSDCGRDLVGIRELAAALDRAYDRDRLLVERLCARLGGRPRRRWLAAGLAAAALAALCIGAAVVFGPRRPESAIVSVNGGTRIGETIEAAAGQTAEVQIRGGARMMLAERTRVSVAPVANAGPIASVSLQEGRIRVTAPKAEGGRPAFFVSTPVGSVQTLGTEFEVALVPSDGKGGQAMNGKLVVRGAPMLLLVTVFAGQVLVQRASGEEEVVAPQAGRLVGQVVGYHRANGILSVKVESTSAGHEELKGKTVEFAAKWKKGDDGKWVRDPDNMKLLFSAITGDKVEIGFHFAERYRVDTLEFVSKVPREGRLVGEVAARQENLLHVKVIKTQAGAEMLNGLTLIFCPEWSKNAEGQWRPDPAHVERLSKAKVGDKVEISYYVNEHYRARALEIERRE